MFVSACVRACVYVPAAPSVLIIPLPLFRRLAALAGTAAMTSSWHHVRTARRPGTVLWWRPAAASCCPRVSREKPLLSPDADADVKRLS